MTYTISGSVNADCKLVIIQENGWTVVVSGVSTQAGFFDYQVTDSGTHTVIAIQDDDGEVEVYGGIEPITT